MVTLGLLGSVWHLQQLEENGGFEAGVAGGFTAIWDAQGKPKDSHWHFYAWLVG